jgi:predicted MFS family arabinose efflux permease
MLIKPNKIVIMPKPANTAVIDSSASPTQSQPPQKSQSSSTQTPNPPPISEPNLWVKLTIGIIGLFAFLQVYSIQAILPVIMQEFQATETQVGMTVGATVMAIALMSPFMGMLSDAIGRRVLIIAAIVLLGIPTALIGFADSLSMITLWRFIQGLAVPGITVVIIAYVGEEFGGKSVARLMSYYVSGTVLGGFLGRFILGHLQELIGWRQGFILMGAATLIGAAWVWWQLPRSRHFVANPNIASSLQMLKNHSQNRYVVTACLLGICVLFSLVGCFTFINLHLSAAPYHLSSAGLANIFTVYLLGVVITPIASQLISKFGAARMVRVAVVISMLGVLLTLAQPLWLIIIGLAVMSSGVFITQSATITYIAVNVKEGRSLASGLYYMCYYLGGTLGAWACGLAFTEGRWALTVWTLLAVQVVALLIAIFGMVKMKRPSA